MPITSSAARHVRDVLDGAAVRSLRPFTSNPPSAGSARRLRRHRTTRCRRPCCPRPRHRLPHHALHLCPAQCRSLRQLAPHDPHRFRPHSPPLKRRGGSLRRVLRHRFPFACAPGFFVPHRLRGLWFSHRTHPDAGPDRRLLDCPVVLQRRQGRYTWAWETWYQIATLPCSAKTPAWIFEGLGGLHSGYSRDSTVTGRGPFPRIRRFSQGAHAQTGP